MIGEESGLTTNRHRHGQLVTLSILYTSPIERKKYRGEYLRMVMWRTCAMLSVEEEGTKLRNNGAL